METMIMMAKIHEIATNNDVFLGTRVWLIVELWLATLADSKVLVLSESDALGVLLLDGVWEIDGDAVPFMAPQAGSPQ